MGSAQLDGAVTYRVFRHGGSPQGDIIDANAAGPSEYDLQPSNGFVWAHIERADLGVVQRVAARLAIHPLAAEDMLNARQRTKIESYNDAVFIVLRSVRLQAGAIVKAEAQLYATPNYIVTVCHEHAIDAVAVCERLAALTGEPAIWKLMYVVMDLVVDQFQPVAARVENGFEALENELFEQNFRRQRIEDLYHIKRQGLRLLACAAPVDDLCAHLISGGITLVPAAAYPNFRDIADHAKQLTEGTQVLKEMVDAALNVNLALVTVGQNEIVKRLAGWGAVLAVPTMVFSLYGMNFTEMPELKWRYGYPVTLTVVLIGCIWLYKRLKKVGWL